MDKKVGNDGLTNEERADFLLSFRKGVGFKSNHEHRVYVEGCFRCELTLDELGVTPDYSSSSGQ